MAPKRKNAWYPATAILLYRDLEQQQFKYDPSSSKNAVSRRYIVDYAKEICPNLFPSTFSEGMVRRWQNCGLFVAGALEKKVEKEKSEGTHRIKFDKTAYDRTYDPYNFEHFNHVLPTYLLYGMRSMVKSFADAGLPTTSPSLLKPKSI